MTMTISKEDLAEFALRLGDDSLIHAQRLCEWTSHAPMLEEDIAIANTGLDYLGRARYFLQYAGNLLNKNEDTLAFLRDASEYRNLLIVELPRGDFAVCMVRQYLLDEFECAYFDALQYSTDPQIAAIAAKTVKEVAYHLRRSREWMRRFGLGTDESRHRAQTALDELWGYVSEFFITDELEAGLVEAGVAVDRSSLEAAWRHRIGELLAETGLHQPDDSWKVTGGREGIHTEHLGHMLGEMQFLQRAYPGLEW